MGAGQVVLDGRELDEYEIMMPQIAGKITYDSKTDGDALAFDREGNVRFWGTKDGRLYRVCYGPEKKIEGDR